jgi:hypothetical protein
VARRGCRFVGEAKNRSRCHPPPLFTSHCPPLITVLSLTFPEWRNLKFSSRNASPYIDSPPRPFPCVMSPPCAIKPAKRGSKAKHYTEGRRSIAHVQPRLPTRDHPMKLRPLEMQFLPLHSHPSFSRT